MARAEAALAIDADKERLRALVAEVEVAATSASPGGPFP